jgi:hypothetical protein
MNQNLNIEVKKLYICVDFDEILWGYIDAVHFILTTVQPNDLFLLTVKLQDFRLAVWMKILGCDTLWFDKSL